jgi:phage baseplate assembly protein W
MANKREGISVALPLTYDSGDGPYRLNKNLEDVIKQNLKNLLLTNPGERIMLPEYGAGIRRFLFEPHNDVTLESVSEAINSSVTSYMPFVEIEKISLLSQEQDDTLSPNSFRIIIEYNVGDIDSTDTLIITESLD